MGKRRAFIGMSGPLAYDYKQAEKYGYPNPILEGSLGLLILYDELIFLTPQLCPVDMLGLSYVSFLSTRAEFAAKMKSVFQNVEAAADVMEQRIGDIETPFATYRPALTKVTGMPWQYDGSTSPFIPDIHSQGVLLDEERNLSINAASARPRNVIIDWMIVKLFRLEDCEVVSNSGNQIFYSKLQIGGIPADENIALGHALVMRELPNYLGPEGPYHKCMEELRSHTFIADARTYIDDLSRRGSQLDVDQLAEAIVVLAQKTRNEVFQKHLKGLNEYKTVATVGLKEVANHAIPLSGAVVDLLEARNVQNEARAIRWSGFIAELADGKWTR